MIGLRLALRSLRRNPLLSAAIVGALALGIGVNVLCFMFTQRMVLRPLDVAEPERVVAAWEVLPERGFEKSHVSPANFLDWAERQRSFESLAASAQLPLHLRIQGRLELGRAAVVTSGFVDLVGARAVVGRLFGEADFADPESRSTVVISHRLWRDRLAADPRVFGTVVHLNEHPYTVVGVLDPATRVPRGADLWVPVRFDDLSPEEGTRLGLRSSRDQRSLMVVGRLRPGVTLEQARSDMLRIAARLSAEYPEENDRAGVNLTLLRDELVSPLASTILLLQAALALVLLVVCVNVANMLLVRAAARRYELSILVAVGGRRYHLLRQLGMEVSLLVGSGAAAGFALALTGQRLLAASPLGTVLDAAALTPDLRLAGFLLLVALASSLVVSLVPLWQVLRARPDIVASQKGRQLSGPGESRFEQALVGAQLALSLPVVFLALQLMNSVGELSKTDLGFEPQGTVVVQLSGSSDRFGASTTRAQALELALARLRALPAVSTAGAVSDLPLSGSNMSGGFKILTGTASEPAESGFRAVTPGYFEAMRIAIEAGRSFRQSDDHTAAGVAIVNQALSRRYWPSESPIGKTVLVGTPQEVSVYGRDVTRRIVGVVADVHHQRLGDEPQPELYVPFAQNPMNYATIAVRLESDGPRALADVRAVIAEATEPHFLISRLATMEEILASSLGYPKLLLYMVSLLGVVATLVVAMSVYAISSHFMTRNQRAIAIRRALGASRQDVVSLVARHALLAWIVGVVAGVLMAGVALRLLDSQVYLVGGPTPSLIAIGVVLLAVTSLLSVLVPIRRALQDEPIAALNAG